MSGIETSKYLSETKLKGATRSLTVLPHSTWRVGLPLLSCAPAAFLTELTSSRWTSKTKDVVRAVNKPRENNILRCLGCCVDSIVALAVILSAMYTASEKTKAANTSTVAVTSPSV